MNESQRTVMIGTPSYDGKLEAYYVDALHNTIMLGLLNYNIKIVPVFMCYDSLVQRARNDLIKIALETKVDDLIFIDADEGWKPEDFIKLLMHDVDIVGGTARKKTDIEQYVVKVFEDNGLLGLKRETNGLIKVAGIGTGFTRLTKKAMIDLWESSEEYDTDNGIKGRLVFDIGIKNGRLISEDISMCDKLSKLGYTIWFDPTITCSHIGIKNYMGDFLTYEQKLIEYGQNKNESVKATE